MHALSTWGGQASWLVGHRLVYQLDDVVRDLLRRAWGEGEG